MIRALLPACPRPPQHRRKHHHGQQKKHSQHFEQDLAADVPKGLKKPEIPRVTPRVACPAERPRTAAAAETLIGQAFRSWAQTHP